MKAGIAGAGITGQLLALSLINAGFEVTLFDQNNNTSTNCSMTAAGLLTPISELDKSDFIISQLGQEALKTHWPHILSQLPKPIYFKTLGSLAVAHPNDHADLSHFIQRIKHRLNEHPGYEKLSQQAIHNLEPELSKFTEAYYFPDEGQIDNQDLLQTLENYLFDRGVKCHRSTLVTAVKPYKIIVANITHDFDMVFDCRGLGSKETFNGLRGIRGELIWLQAKEVKLSRPIRFLHPRYSLYIVPRPESIYLVGASEIESEDMTSISVKTTLELLTAAYYLHPGFAEARILKSVTHCRPTLPHHLPQIKSSKGLIAINGLYRHGYLIAPTLIHDVLKYLDKGLSSYPQLWEEK